MTVRVLKNARPVPPVTLHCILIVYVPAFTVGW